MKLIKEADFRKEIKSSPDKAYLFFGEEDYMKQFAISLAKQTISADSAFSFFNEIKFDSLTYSPEALLDAIMTLPMATEKKIIILSDLIFNGTQAIDIDSFCDVLSTLDEYDYNVVIINTSPDSFDVGNLPKKPSSAFKKLTEHATAVQFSKNSPQKLVAWVEKHYAHNGVSASPELCALTIERCSRDLFTLASETDKISFFVLSRGRSVVTREDIMTVSSPVAEYQAFALTNAIGKRQKDLALNILKDMKQRRLDPIMIMGEISKSVCDIYSVNSLSAEGLTVQEIASVLHMSEFPVTLILKNNISQEICKNMIEKSRDCDLELKLGKNGFLLLEKLICSI